MPEKHETASKQRYDDFQIELKKTTDGEALKILKDKVEIQLKLEEFLVKSRQGGHPKMTVWGPLIVPAVVSLIVAILAVLATLFLRTSR